MANTDDAVLAAVADALKERPDASVEDLFDLAKKISPDIAALSKRQFHARYPLQVKRKLAPPRKGPGRRRKSAPRGAKAKSVDTSAREAVRASFLKFASDLAGAEARKDVVRVVASVDRYVDEVLKATGQL